MAAVGETRSARNASRANQRAKKSSSPDTNSDNRSVIRDDLALSELISGEIIPRLLISHPAAIFPPRITGGRAIDPAEAEQFAELPLELEADELLELVETHIERGVSIESVFVELLAPAARRLGEYWEEDKCDFVDVTMGLWRLQEVMRGVARRYAPEATARVISRSALFAPFPGEQHSFGPLMIEEIFARAGWQSEVLLEPRRHDLLETVAERPFELVGLTISCDCPSSEIADLVSSIRKASRSVETQIFIGGRVVNANPDLVGKVGADGTAPDARSALALAERIVLGARRFDLLEP